jgi:hypothetical protein
LLAGSSVPGLSQSSGPAPSPPAESTTVNALQDIHVDKIRKYFKSTKPALDPVEVTSIEVQVGASAPADVKTEPLPGAILVDLPAGVDYQYFLWGDSLVIVNAETRIVVAVVPKAS